MVGGGCPPQESPRCRGRAGARSAPASPLVSQKPPGIPPPGTVVGFPSGSLSCMSLGPQLSGGPRGAAVVRPSRVESSSDLTGIRHSCIRHPRASLHRALSSASLWKTHFVCPRPPQSSGGPRGAAVVRPSRVKSSSDSTGIQPRVPPHTPNTPLSLAVVPEMSSRPPLFAACTPPRSGFRTPPDRGDRPC